VGGVFGKAAELRAYRRESKDLVEGRALSELPCTRLGRDERNIHDLEIGRGCGGVGLDGNKAQYRKEAVHMLEDICNVRRGRDSRRSNEDAGSSIKGGLQNDVGIDIFPKVGVDLPDKLRGDGVGVDGRSGRQHCFLTCYHHLPLLGLVDLGVNSLEFIAIRCRALWW
jgi:hypothetical protein